MQDLRRVLGAVVFRHLDFSGVMAAARSSARMTAGLFLLIAAAEVVNYVLILGGIGEGIGSFVSIFREHPKAFLLVCVVAFR